jgi:DNA invertase Pin-like site-specific DNA recombinase
VNGEHKIGSGHRSRLAAVYLRQSSMAQVREHTESTARQYALQDEAVRLGWARGDVLVIDTDLGLSGRWGVARAGFTELVTRVCSGEVGAIFGIEISRPARSNAEVARLMEFASITQTLLIDADGVYDPRDVNDRMLLGMKSTLGEVGLHVMAQRLQASKKAAAARGELRTPLPVGYVYDAGETVIDPDAEVQAAIRDLFAGFACCGSAYGVVAAFTGRRFPLRAYGGAWGGQLRWETLTHARVLGVLRNPCYAGAYVHGRYTSRRRVDPDGTVHTGLVERPRSQWPVLITDHHEGYISWADYLAIEARLAANRTNTGGRPPREGSALCQGIIACGLCGTHQLPQRHPPGLRMQLPRRPADHPDLPLGHRGHRRRRGRRVPARGVDTAPGRSGAGRRRPGGAAPTQQPRRRPGRATRPLRSRPRRTRLPRRRTRKPAGRPQPGDPLGIPPSRSGRGRAGARRRHRHAATAAHPGRGRAGARRRHRHAATAAHPSAARSAGR